MSKITKLTPEQESRLIEFREEWRQIGLSCEPADFAAGDEVIRGFYKRIGKPDPMILHFSSPAMCELAVNVVFALLAKDGSHLDSHLRSQLDSHLRSHLYSQLSSHLYSQLDSHLYSQLSSQLYSHLYIQLSSQLYSHLDSHLRSQLDSHLDSHLYSQLDIQLDSQLSSQLSSQLDSHLYSQLYSQLSSQLDSHLRSQLSSQLSSHLDSHLYSQLYSQLDSQLYSHLDSHLRSQLSSQLSSIKPYFSHNRWGGGHWCAWEASFLFGHEIGVEYKAEDMAILLEWARISQSVGWWAPWDGVCFVSDRPREVHFDENRLLHNEFGASVKYSDGWGVHTWHGVKVPEKWIENRSTLDPNEVIRADNVEQRAAGASIVGWPKMLSVLDAKVINDSGNPDLGELIELTLPGLPEPGRFLKAKCPRNGIIVEGVPRVSDIDGLPIDTALAAQAWRIGDPQSEYTHPPQRT